MDAVELRKLTNESLEAKLRDFQQEAFNLRFQQATMQLVNTARIRVVKKAIARIMTLMRERAMTLKGVEV